MLERPDLQRVPDSAIDPLRRYVVARGRSVDPEEVEVDAELEDFVERWRRRRPTEYWDDRERRGPSLLQSAELAATARALGRPVSSAFPVMNSMRNVEPSTQFELIERRRSRRRR